MMSNFQFESVADFFTMAGHGSYVWFSYFITIIAITLLIQVPVWKKRQLLTQLKRQQRMNRTSPKYLKS